ncbi:MAG: hypothetical protein HYX69_23255 [Planctomycetia bacterium]|nr:hypothetical protein [Planctomycetia bacterium]
MMNGIPQRAKPQASFLTVLIEHLCAVLLVSAAMAAGLVGCAPSAGPPDVDAARPAADEFLRAIQSGQSSQAWESTTAEFKSAQGREKFLRYVKEHKFLGKPLDFVSAETVTIQKRPQAEYVFRSGDGRATVRLLARNENGAWRIDRMLID